MTSSALQSFAQQAARNRRALSPVTVQPCTAAGAAIGKPVSVFLTPFARTEELGENGIIIIHKAQLRALKTLSWQPAEGSEFEIVSTGELARCRSATGADSPLSAEIVCDVIRIRANG